MGGRVNLDGGTLNLDGGSRTPTILVLVIKYFSNTAPFEGMLQRWRVVGSIVSDLTSPRFVLRTSGSQDERVTV